MKNTNLQTEIPRAESIRKPRLAYDALIAERSSDKGFDATYITFEGFVPIKSDTPQEVSYN